MASAAVITSPSRSYSSRGTSILKNAVRLKSSSIRELKETASGRACAGHSLAIAARALSLPPLSPIGVTSLSARRRVIAPFSCGRYGARTAEAETTSTASSDARTMSRVESSVGLHSVAPISPQICARTQTRTSKSFTFSTTDNASRTTSFRNSPFSSRDAIYARVIARSGRSVIARAASSASEIALTADSSARSSATAASAFARAERSLNCRATSRAWSAKLFMAFPAISDDRN